MKKIIAALLLSFLLITTASAIIVCHDYALFRVTGNDPRPVSGKLNAGCSVGELRSGWSDSEPAILDTGSPISVLPPTLWKTLDVKLLSQQPTSFYGVGTPAASLKGHLGEVTCMIHDDFNTSPPLRLKAHLIEADVAPILFGFEDILPQADLVVRHRKNEAYLEF